MDHSEVFLLFQGTNDPFISVTRPEQEPMTDGFQVEYILGFSVLSLRAWTVLPSSVVLSPNLGIAIVSWMNGLYCPFSSFLLLNPMSERTRFSAGGFWRVILH